MEDESTLAEAEMPAAAHPTASAARVFCFVSKHDILETEAVQIPYLKGEKVWVGKQYIKYKI